jgi:hypothetical protein
LVGVGVVLMSADLGRDMVYSAGIGVDVAAAILTPLDE